MMLVRTRKKTPKATRAKQISTPMIVDIPSSLMMAAITMGIQQMIHKPTLKAKVIPWVDL